MNAVVEDDIENQYINNVFISYKVVEYRKQDIHILY